MSHRGRGIGSWATAERPDRHPRPCRQDHRVPTQSRQGVGGAGHCCVRRWRGCHRSPDGSLDEFPKGTSDAALQPMRGGPNGSESANHQKFTTPPARFAERVTVVSLQLRPIFWVLRWAKSDSGSDWVKPPDHTTNTKDHHYQSVEVKSGHRQQEADAEGGEPQMETPGPNTAPVKPSSPSAPFITATTSAGCRATSFRPVA